MDFFVFSIGIRNILLAHLLIIILAPDYAVNVRQEMLRIWKSIHAPFLHRKARKKGSSFWEIDMTKFEP